VTGVWFVTYIYFVTHTYHDVRRAFIREGCYCQVGKVHDSCAVRDIYIVRDSYIQ